MSDPQKSKLEAVLDPEVSDRPRRRRFSPARIAGPG